MQTLRERLFVYRPLFSEIGTKSLWAMNWEGFTEKVMDGDSE